MRNLTTHELDGQMAEQLPARELMGSCWTGGKNNGQPSSSHSYNTSHSNNTAAAGNGNNSGNNSLVSANGNSVAVSLFGNSAAGNNGAAAGN